MSSVEKAGGREGQGLFLHVFAVEPKSPCERSWALRLLGCGSLGDAPKL